MTASNPEGRANGRVLDGDNPTSSTVNNNTAYEINKGIDLPAQIHTASRAIHATLHHAVVGRIPLALPPKATSPHLYALGISRFAQIYSVLEDAWRDQLEATPPAAGDGTKENTARRHRALLAEAYVPAIARSQRLQSDLRNLKAEWGNTIPDGNDVAVREAVSHMLDTIRTKPYVLLAYSWIMYLALFNGGRWIREQLLNAGPQFWHKDMVASPKTEKEADAESFLSFWYFDGNEDGEDIKLAYRAGFIKASKRLTEDECDHVIGEAKALFQYCLDMVTEIDLVVALERKQRGAEHALGAYNIYAMLGLVALGAFLAMAVTFYRR